MKPFSTMLLSIVIAFSCSLLQAKDSWRSQATAKQITALEAVCKPNPFSSESTTIQLPRWNGFTVNKHSNLEWSQDTNQRLTVYAIYPSKSKAADWVGNAVLDEKSEYDHDFAMGFAKWIKSRTNFRIPVAGFVDEDQGTYVFRDGIAVLIDTSIIPKDHDGSVQIKTAAKGMKITEAMTEAALSPKRKLLKGAGVKSRVATTTPHEYYSILPPTIPGWNPGGWDPDLLRTILKTSLNENRCELVRKFLQANPTGKR